MMNVSRRGFLKALGIGSVISLINPLSFFKTTSIPPPINTTKYGEISYKTAAYYSAELLKRAQPHMLLNKFGQIRELPKANGKTIKFRRYANLNMDYYEQEIAI